MAEKEGERERERKKEKEDSGRIEANREIRRRRFFLQGHVLLCARQTSGGCSPIDNTHTLWFVSFLFSFFLFFVSALLKAKNGKSSEGDCRLLHVPTFFIDQKFFVPLFLSFSFLFLFQQREEKKRKEKKRRRRRRKRFGSFILCYYCGQHWRRRLTALATVRRPSRWPFATKECDPGADNCTAPEVAAAAAAAANPTGGVEGVGNLKAI